MAGWRGGRRRRRPVLDCGFCLEEFLLLLLLLLFRFVLFFLLLDVDGLDSIVVEAAAVDDDLVAFRVFLLRLTMNSADDDDS